MIWYLMLAVRCHGPSLRSSAHALAVCGHIVHGNSEPCYTGLTLDISSQKCHTGIFPWGRRLVAWACLGHSVGLVSYLSCLIGMASTQGAAKHRLLTRQHLAHLALLDSDLSCNYQVTIIADWYVHDLRQTSVLLWPWVKRSPQCCRHGNFACFSTLQRCIQQVE